MPVDEVDVAADGFVEQLDEPLPRIVLRHHVEHVGEVFDEVENHARSPGND
jgi:hypothetical protein